MKFVEKTLPDGTRIIHFEKDAFERREADCARLRLAAKVKAQTERKTAKTQAKIKRLEKKSKQSRSYKKRNTWAQGGFDGWLRNPKHPMGRDELYDSIRDK